MISANDQALPVSDHSLCDLARVTFLLFSMLIEQRMQKHCISSGQWIFLRELLREDGISQQELSRRLALSDATTSMSLQTMEKASLVCRYVNRFNRREKLVFISLKVKCLERALLAIASDIQHQSTKGFSDKEIDKLRSLLLQVNVNLTTEQSDVC